MSDILSATSILLAIITLFYEKNNLSIKNLLDKSIPPKEQKKEHDKFVRDINRHIIFSVVYNLIYVFFCWILVPTTYNICKNSVIDLIKFDITNTIFFILNITILVIMISSVVNTYRLIKKKLNSV